MTSKPMTKPQRLAMYKRTLKVLETFVANDCKTTVITIKVNQYKTHHNIRVLQNLGLCSLMGQLGSIHSYARSRYHEFLPELYKVGMKHKCAFTKPYWFRFKGTHYALTTKGDYEKRIEFMKQVIKETLNS
jgi:phage gp36-like protein